MSASLSRPANADMTGRPCSICRHPNRVRIEGSRPANPVRTRTLVRRSDRGRVQVAGTKAAETTARAVPGTPSRGRIRTGTAGDGGAVRETAPQSRRNRGQAPAPHHRGGCDRGNARYCPCVGSATARWFRCAGRSGAAACRPLLPPRRRGGFRLGRSQVGCSRETAAKVFGGGGGVGGSVTSGGGSSFSGPCCRSNFEETL
jgi:hypothetical protein